MNKKKLFYTILFISAIITGIYLRASKIFSSFEYDEIYTLSNWISKDYWTLLSTLNNMSNHPLSSCVVKFMHSFKGINYILIRLPYLLCGIGTIITAYFSARLITKNKLIANLTMLLCAFHPGLIYYSHCSRGYALATFFISLFFLMELIWIYKSENLSTKKRILTSSIMFLSMAAACMSIPSVILFVIPVLIIHLFILLIKYKKANHLPEITKLVKSNIELIVSWVLITSFAALIYIGNYSSFKSATGMAAGTKLESFGSIVIFFNELFPKLASWTLLAFAVLILLRKKYLNVFLCSMFIFLFSFSSLIFAKGGPARTYLPLAPLCCFLAACGIYIVSHVLAKFTCKNKKNPLVAISCVLALATGINFYISVKWAPIDWFKTFEYIKKIPKDTMVVYRVCETYSLSYSIYDKAFVDNFTRINKIRDGKGIIFFDIPNNEINGNNSKGGETTHKIDTSGLNLEIRQIRSTLYKLKKLSPEEEIHNKALVAVIPFLPLKYKDAAIVFLRSQPNTEWLLANPYLVVPETRNGKRYSSAVLLSAKHNLKAKELIDISRKSKGKIRFYTIVTP